MKYRGLSLYIAMISIAQCLFLHRAEALSCDSSYLSIKHESGLLSFLSSALDREESESNSRVNVPVRTSAGDGCFTLDSHLKIQVKLTNKLTEYEIDVKPMQTKQDNIPDFHQESLIHFIDNENRDLVKISVFSLACSGSVPLTAESYQGKLVDIYKEQEEKNTKVSSSMIFATGAAAVALQKRKMELIESNIDSSFSAVELESNNLNEYLEKLSLPDFFIAERTVGRHTNLAHSIFSREGKIINICDPRVKERFEKYSLESFQNKYADNDTLKFKIKSDRILIKKRQK